MNQCFVCPYDMRNFTTFKTLTWIILVPVPIFTNYQTMIFPGSFHFISPLSATSTADRIIVSWTPTEPSPTDYVLNTICTWPCDNSSLPHTASTPGPADTSVTITGLLPGSTCNIALTALYGVDIISNTLTTQSETMASGKHKNITYIYHIHITSCTTMHVSQRLI